MTRKTQGQNALPKLCRLGSFGMQNFKKFCEPCTIPFKFKLTNIAVCRRHNKSFIFFVSSRLKIGAIICRLNIPAFYSRVDGSLRFFEFQGFDYRAAGIDMSAHFLEGKESQSTFWASSDRTSPSVKELRREPGSELEGHIIFFFVKQFWAFQSRRGKEANGPPRRNKNL